MLDGLVADDIPNIRFNVAKTYAVLIDTLKKLPEGETVLAIEKAGTSPTPSPKGQELIQHSIVPNLEKLRNDEDVDVRYFATTAMANVDGGDVMQT